MKVDREAMPTPFEGVYATGDVRRFLWSTASRCPRRPCSPTGRQRWWPATSLPRSRVIGVDGPFGGEGACFLETGYAKAAYTMGDFCAKPNPEVRMRQPSFLWRWVKEGFIRTWLWRLF